MMMNAMKGLAALCLGLALSACGGARDPGATDEGAESVEADEKADGLSTTSTYYWVRRDMRKCAAPGCGGYYVQRVNKATTRCTDGSWRDKCYVSSIDFGAQVSDGARLVRGTIGPDAQPGFGKLTATEAYHELGSGAAEFNPAMREEPFYRITDRGLRCAKAPCPSWHRAKLNQTYSSVFDGIELKDVGAMEEADEAALWNSPYSGGMYVTGYVRYDGGSVGRTFEVAHAFLANPKAAVDCAAALCAPGTVCVDGQGCVAQNTCQTDSDCPTIYCITTPCPTNTCVAGVCQVSTPPKKACYTGGCSGQVCSDNPNVITTCIYRPEYACYHNATCEQQASGECGWTHTAELDACLASPPPL